MRRHRRGRALRRRYGHSRWDDFDLRSEIQEGAVVHMSRGSGYDVSFTGRHLGHFKSRGGAFRAIAEKMEREKYWPNVFFVNDHGNTDLFAIRIAENGKVMSRLIKSWV